MRNKIINLNELIFEIVLLFPIAAVVERLQVFSNINKVLIAIIILLLGLKTMNQKMKRKEIFILIVGFAVYFASFYFTTKELDNFNDIFFLGLWILFFLWMKTNFNEIRQLIYKKDDLIYNMIVLWNIIVLISMFFKSSYFSTWGENTTYFRSFSTGEHRFAAACIFIIALNWIIVQNRNDILELGWSIIPFISIYMSGARTYLVIILIFAMCIYKHMCKSSKRFYLSMIPIIILLTLAIRFTPMWSKFEYTFYDGYWGWMGTVTSGRSVFWAADIEAFNKLNIVQKFVGNGYNFVYDVNSMATGPRIWAHNDFINLLLTYGILGVLSYLYVFIGFTEYILKKYKIKGFFKASFYMIWLFNAMFNMVYTYICATFALPFILYSFIQMKEKKDYIDRKSEKNENICGNT